LNAGEKLWKVWWLWGIPTAWAASALVLAAEELRVAGWHSTGSLLDVARLAVYWAWCRLAWQSSGNLGNTCCTLLSRSALATGLVATVLV
jgi:hypothetical protein